MQKFKPAGLTFGALLLVVPGYAIYHHTGLNQQAYVANMQETAHLDWAQAQTSPINSQEALARANTCVIGRNPDMSPTETEFNRQFSFASPEDAKRQEGRFYCALDGSTVQIIGGKATSPVLVDPADLSTYHEVLVERHNVDVTHILKFTEKTHDYN